jgi:hypothetical protein
VKKLDFKFTLTMAAYDLISSRATFAVVDEKLTGPCVTFAISPKEEMAMRKVVILFEACLLSTAAAADTNVTIPIRCPTDLLHLQQGLFRQRCGVHRQRSRTDVRGRRRNRARQMEPE